MRGVADVPRVEVDDPGRMAVLDRFPELRPPLDAEEALLEADRCLDCAGPYAPPPCTVACPAGVDVPRFVRELAAGQTLDAARTIYRENLLGGTCARVCPVEVLCQSACVLSHIGQEPIEIAALQRHATDVARDHGLPLRARPSARALRVAVVGAGPAGLSCAGELAARGFDVVFFDEHTEVGGIVRTAIAPYRQLVDPLPAERLAPEQLGVRFELGVRIDSPERLAELVGDADAVFVGVGLGGDRPLDCLGADLAGSWPSLEFIGAIKQGEPIDVGRNVVVLGGGNTAIDVAREALRLGAESVTLAYRRTRELMPAYAFEVADAEAEGVAFEWLVAPVALLGSGRVEAIVLERMRPGEGRALEVVPDSRFTIPADTVVAAIGQEPRRDVAAWFGGVELAGGAVAIDEATGRTSVPRVYAGGDVVNGGASAVQAVAEGKRAARAIEEALCPS
jgi:dihydropyrimidine dehydrogenase (NAD+) subunit PreT